MKQLIAYDTTDLEALAVTEKAADWQQKNFISKDKLNAIQKHYLTAFYTPNVFVRVGLFIFCCILVFSLFGLFALMGFSENGLGYSALFVGVGCFVGLELMIQSRHFRSGIDDALLYCGLSFTIGGLTFLLKLDADTLSFYWIFLPLLIVAAVRYLDGLIAAVVFGFLLTIIVLTTLKFSIMDPSVLLLILAFFAAIAYFFTQKAQQNVAFRFWHNGLSAVEGLSLVVFYTSCNAYVLEQTNETFFDNSTFTLAPLFWVLTFLIPLFYIYQGLKRRNRLLLSMGLLAIAAGVATFRYYFHVVPMEVAAVVGGAVLLAFAYFSIRYLKRHTTPFTYEENGKKPFYQEAESLIIAQSLGNAAPQEDGTKPQFGGGDFGGGGAGQEF